jgi:hypothetical protein
MKNKAYIHHIPGRLRVCTQAIKNDRAAATQLQNSLAAIPGVTSASANTLTGSTIVTYNTKRVNSEIILDVFRHSGYLETTHANETMRAVSSPAASLFTVVILPKLGVAILGWTVERALTAAFSVLL